MAIFSEFWNFTILSNGEKKCAEYMGPIKKLPNRSGGAKSSFGDYYTPYFRKSKKIPYGPHVGVDLYGRWTNKLLYIRILLTHKIIN